MRSRPAPVPPQPADAVRDGASPVVAVLEAGTGLAELLAAAGVTVRAAATLDELVGLAEAGAVGAAVVDPELGGGWPADAAEVAVERLAGRVPLVLVCRSARDAAVIETRTDGRGAVVLLRDKVRGDALAAILAGRTAARGAARPRTGRA